MDQFAFMVDTLTDYSKKCVDNYYRDEEELLNESLAMVESTLLHGYTMLESAHYQTVYKSVTLRVS
jgi:hypothetical protein